MILDSLDVEKNYDHLIERNVLSLNPDQREIQLKTFDGRFVLESVSKEEFKNLRRNINRIIKYQLENPDSMIMPILGLYSIQFEDIS